MSRRRDVPRSRVSSDAEDPTGQEPAYRCMVTPIDRRSETRSTLLITSLPRSSKQSTFHVMGSCGVAEAAPAGARKPLLWDSPCSLGSAASLRLKICLREAAQGRVSRLRSSHGRELWAAAPRRTDRSAGRATSWPHWPGRSPRAAMLAGGWRAGTLVTVRLECAGVMAPPAAGIGACPRRKRTARQTRRRRRGTESVRSRGNESSSMNAARKNEGPPTCRCGRKCASRSAAAVQSQARE